MWQFSVMAILGHDRSVMDGFFDDDDEPVSSNKRAASNADEDEVDPLDAFMMEVETELKEQPASTGPSSSGVLMVRFCLCVCLFQQRGNQSDEAEDHMEDFLAFREDNEMVAAEEDVVDEDGKQIDLNTLDLPPLDHSSIVYEPFKKNVLVPVSGQTLVEKEVADAFRKQHDIRVRVDEGIIVPPVAPTIEGVVFAILFFVLFCFYTQQKTKLLVLAELSQHISRKSFPHRLRFSLKLSQLLCVATI
jgi:hypothetical protein